MVTATTAAPVMAQTATYSMNPNPQDRPCLQRHYPCCKYLIRVACMIVCAGALTIAVGSSTSNDTFYASYPQTRRSTVSSTLNSGIAVFIIGIILMIFSIYWCHYVKRNFSTPTIFSGTALTTTVVATNTASTSGVVQPPPLGSQPTYVYSYQPSQQVESIQQAQPATNQYQPVQPATNQYPPVQPAINQYPPVQPMEQPSAPPEMLPDQPPPTYNELMQPTDYSTKSYGNV